MYAHMRSQRASAWTLGLFKAWAVREDQSADPDKAWVVCEDQSADPDSDQATWSKLTECMHLHVLSALLPRNSRQKASHKTRYCVVWNSSLIWGAQQLNGYVLIAVL